MKPGNKILLLYPPISKFERYSSEIGNAGGEQIPLGIFYIASTLQKNNFEVKVIDAEAEHLNTEQILDEITSFSPSYMAVRNFKYPISCI